MGWTGQGGGGNGLDWIGFWFLIFGSKLDSVHGFLWMHQTVQYSPNLASSVVHGSTPSAAAAPFPCFASSTSPPPSTNPPPSRRRSDSLLHHHCFFFPSFSQSLIYPGCFVCVFLGLFLILVVAGAGEAEEEEGACAAGRWRGCPPPAVRPRRQSP